MPDYDFRGLSARSFEHLVQALSTQVLGPGVVVFGDGPDGGREVTFEGKVPYPSQSEQWDGYIVMQAKFKARTDTPARDGAWLKRELTKELSKFTRRHLRRPEYYILCTNVVLTPVQARGTKATIDEVFSTFSSKLGLRDFAVWDYDKLCKYLDAHPSVRQTYAAWITPGDVLSAILDSVQFERPDFAAVVHNFIQKELLADRFANLEQAGYKADDRIPLGQVFVDLPVSPERYIAPPSDSADTALSGCVSSVLAESSERLSESCRPSVERRLRGPGRHDTGRFVIIGGPGQGKSTVGQFICQMYRSALILGRPKAKLSKEVKEAIAELSAQARTEGLELPATRRFPLRVTLSEFADALAGKTGAPVPSLLAYIAQRMSVTAAFDVSTQDVRRWLSVYPWLLVLDGLDEVPASGNREAVLSKVQDFWIDTSDADGDVLVLATTRPQGYSDDFAPKHYRHLWLAPLSPHRALHYATRFTSARFGNDPSRSQKVIRRLQRAASHEATARLMQTPLQITIMAILVDQGGEPPQERWRLFRQYYDVIYRREVERRIAAAAVLQEYQSDVDAIHSSVGFLLQVESERTGNADAKLSAAQFQSVVEDRLINEGHQGAALVDLTEKIIYAASQRLVFLVGLESGIVGFEIRSLQEFMAAEGLMAGSDDDAANRMMEIASLTSWRNVFLFAAGRCFADRQYMRDVICNIAATLNDTPDDKIARSVLAGSLLAADILEDGAARQQPKYQRQLTRLALRALDLMSPDVQSRLAKLYDESVLDIYSEEISSRLGHQDPRRRQGAWRTALRLAAADVDWAVEMVREQWPVDANEEIGLLEMAMREKIVPLSVVDRLVARAGALSLWLVFGDRHSAAEVDRWPRKLLKWRRSAESLESAPNEYVLAVNGPVPPLAFELVGVAHDAKRIRLLGEVLSVATEWKSAEALRTFLRSPDASGLSEALLILSDAPTTENLYPLLGRAPWPLAALVAHGWERKEFRALSASAAAGLFGSSHDWLSAEHRWLSVGMTLDDVMFLIENEARLPGPFDSNIATQGFPLNSWFDSSRGPLSSRTLEPLFVLCTDLERSLVKRRLVEIMLRLWSSADLDVSPLIYLVEQDREWFLGSPTIRYLLVRIASRLDRLDSRWIAILNEVGRCDPQLHRYSRPGDFVAKLALALLDDLSLNGLLRLIACYAQDDVTDPTLRKIIPTEFDAIGDREAATIVRASLVSVDDLKPVIGWTLSLLHEKPEARSAILSALVAARPRRESTGELALATAESRFEALSVHDLSRLATVLTETLQSRRSNLDREAVWKKLRLPPGLHALLAN